MNDEWRAELVLPFDDDGIEHLVAGDDAVPDDLRPVAPLLAAARHPATAAEMAGEAEFTALFRQGEARHAREAEQARQALIAPGTGRADSPARCGSGSDPASFTRCRGLRMAPYRA